MKPFLKIFALVVALLATVIQASATITADGSIATASVKTSGASWTFTTSADCTSGHICFFTFATDNAAPTGGNTDGNASEHTSVTDAAGNFYMKLREFTNTQSAAAGGSTVSVWMTKAISTLTAGSNVTLTLRVAVTAKAVQGESFSVGSGNILIMVGGSDLSNDGADPGSITLSSLSSVEHLFIRATGHEGPNTDSYTASTSYSAWTSTSSGTTGSTAATNMSVRTEYRITTGTTDSTDPTYTAVDHVSSMIALAEVPASAGIFLDSTASSNCSNCTSLTYSHNVVGNTNSILVFQSVGYDGTDTDCTPTGVTFNTVAMTRIVAAAVTSGNAHTERWYLLNPATGAHNIVATLPNTNSCAAYHGNSLALTGVSQTSPVDLNATATGNSTTPAVSITTGTDLDFVVEVGGYLRGSAATIWVGTSGQVREFNFADTVNDDHSWGSYRGSINPAGAIAFNWTQGDVGAQAWAESATAFKVATSSSNQVGSVSETLTISPTVMAISAQSVAVSETLTTGSSVGALASKPVNVSLSLTTTPSVTALSAHFAAVSESSTTSGSVAAVKPGSRVVNVVESMMVESLVESDSVDAQVNLSPRSPNVVVDLNLIVNAAALVGRSRVPVENLSTVATVSVSPFAPKVAPVLENNVTTDSVTRQAVHFIAVAENHVTADTCTTCTMVENLTTLASVSTSVQRNPVSVVTESKSTLDFAAGVKTLNPFSKNVTDNLSESESVLVVRGPMIFETLTTASSVTVSSQHLAGVNENLTTSGFISVSTPNAMNRGATEPLTTSASVSVSAAHFASANETLTTSAAVVNASAHLAGVIVNLSVNDAVGVVTPTVHSASVVESLSIGDVAGTRLVLGANLFEIHVTSDLAVSSTKLTPRVMEFSFAVDDVNVRVMRFGFRRRFVLVVIP